MANLYIKLNFFLLSIVENTLETSRTNAVFAVNSSFKSDLWRSICEHTQARCHMSVIFAKKASRSRKDFVYIKERTPEKDLTNVIIAIRNSLVEDNSWFIGNF